MQEGLVRERPVLLHTGLDDFGLLEEHVFLTPLVEERSRRVLSAFTHEEDTTA